LGVARRLRRFDDWRVSICADLVCLESENKSDESGGFDVYYR
jgi:hypothetical protein